jgi:single-strand DNA-binding protein
VAATNINRVVLTGNLTRDPELRSTSTGTNVCSLRIATNTRQKDPSGEWTDRAHYFSVTVFGAQGENCARFLSKGRPVAIDGRLQWREWQDKDGNKRESIEIVAESVQFLGGRDDAAGNGNGFTPRSDVPADTRDFEPAGSPAAGGSSNAGEDDIPF